MFFLVFLRKRIYNEYACRRIDILARFAILIFVKKCAGGRARAGGGAAKKDARKR
jgi:hypothetical protein